LRLNKKICPKSLTPTGRNTEQDLTWKKRERK
jgi:hypothetical protein